MQIALALTRRKESHFKEFSDRQRAREKTLNEPLGARESCLDSPDIEDRSKSWH